MQSVQIRTFLLKELDSTRSLEPGILGMSGDDVLLPPPPGEFFASVRTNVLVNLLHFIYIVRPI
jgi:hypothetical protein